MNNLPAACCPHCGKPLDAAQAGSADAIPPGVKGWSWGAFLLSGIWAIANRTWIGLLVFVPYLWFVMPFVLGYMGREWAWKNRRWESVEQFKRVQQRWSEAGIAAAIAMVLAFALMPLPDSNVVKAKLSRVASTLDPIKTAVALACQDKGRIPAMHTIVTAASRGKPATPDWAALGFDLMPALPPEVKRLEFSAQESPEIVVELDKIDKAIDGATLRAKLIANEGNLAWQYEVSSSDQRAQKFFLWSGTPVPVPNVPTPAPAARARKAGYCR